MRDMEQHRGDNGCRKPRWNPVVRWHRRASARLVPLSRPAADRSLLSNYFGDSLKPTDQLVPSSQTPYTPRPPYSPTIPASHSPIHNTNARFPHQLPIDAERVAWEREVPLSTINNACRHKNEDSPASLIETGGHWPSRTGWKYDLGECGG